MVELKDMARQALIREPGLLNDVFLTVGAKGKKKKIS
jgi:hypothetical protein